MIVDAVARFRCGHRLIATTKAELLYFTCEHCGYRTELLPLDRLPRPAQVIPFAGRRGRVALAGVGRSRPGEVA